MVNSIFWIVAIVLFVLLEATTATLVCIWFAGGSLVALIANLLGASTMVQILIFLVVSVVCALLLRKAALKYVTPEKSKTNLDRIIGETVYVKEILENGDGKASVNDVDWKVKPEKGEALSVGDRVTVTAVEGVKLVVKK